MAEKMQIVKNKDVQIEALNERQTQMLKEKEKLMREYGNEIRARETEMDSIRIRCEEDIARKERENQKVKKRYEETVKKLEQQREQEQNLMREDFEQRIN